VRKTVQVAGSRGAEDFYSLKQPEYVNVFAVTTDRRALLVKQFRPAIERFTWELPAGVRDPGETARTAAGRELREETGWRMVEMVNLGRNYIDTGRLGNCFHSFAAIVTPTNKWIGERGIETSLVPLPRLRLMILKGQLSLQTHVGLVLNSVTNPKTLRMFARHGLGDIKRLFLRI
jgi:ADP-ribose pyrophosphatase